MESTPGGDGSPSALLGPVEVRALARRLGIQPTKQLGQNFVIDPNTIRRIVRSARLEPDEPVLEVGPGLGSLTLGLLAAGHPVTAVEIDERLAGELPATVAERLPAASGRLRVVRADALRVRELPGPAPTALVANLPYNVAVPVLLHLLEQFPSLERVLVMVQLEVADRLAAEPGGRVYGVPSVKARWYGRVHKAGVIGKNVFWPAPHIESGLVALTRHAPGEFPADGALEPADTAAASGAPATTVTAAATPGDGDGDTAAGAEAAATDSSACAGPAGAAAETPACASPAAAADPAATRTYALPGPAESALRREVFAVVDAAFAQRRKTLRAALSGWAGSAAEAERVLRRAGVDPGARGEALGVRQYVAIAIAARESARETARDTVEEQQ